MAEYLFEEETPSAAPVPVQTPAVAPTPAPFTPTTYGFEEYTPDQVSTSADVGRAAAAQGTKGVTVDVAGIPGAALYYGQKFGDFIRGDEAAAERKALRAQGLTPEEAFDVEEGFSVSRPYSPGMTGPRTMPTMQGMERFTEEKLPYTQYEAQTPLGQIVGSGVRAGTSIALTGKPSVTGALTRGTTGALAGAAGRGVGLLTEDISTPLSVGSEVATNIAVDYLTRNVGKVAYDLAHANPEAMTRLATSIRASMTPEKIEMLNAAARRGEPVNINDYIDAPTRDWIKKNMPGNYGEQVIAFEASLIPRRLEIDASTNEMFTDVFGQDLSEVGWQTALARAQKADTDAFYDAARANPNAQNVWTPEIQNILRSDGNIFEAAQEVSKEALENKIPEAVPIGFAKLAKNMPAQPQLSMNRPPNLIYWDEVKRNLDSKANSAETAGDFTLARRYKKAAEKLRNEVSSVVPEYGDARAAGALGFQTADALKEGYQFGSILTARKPNLERFDEFRSTFDRASDEIKQRYRQGVGRSILQIAQSGDFKDASRLMSSRENQRMLEHILGPDQYARVYGEIAKNSLLKSTTGLAREAGAVAGEATQASSKGRAGEVLTSLATGTLTGGGALIAGTALPVTAGIATAGAILGYAAKAGLDAKEQKVMSRVVELAISQDPKDVAALGKILKSDLSAVTGLRKLTDFAANSTRTALYTRARQEEYKRQNEGQIEGEEYFVTPDVIPGLNDGQANGGRVGRKSGGRIANSISTEVDRTRALLSNKTASMLSMPDDAIVTALNHAKNT